MQLQNFAFVARIPYEKWASPVLSAPPATQPHPQNKCSYTATPTVIILGILSSCLLLRLKAVHTNTLRKKNTKSVLVPPAFLST
jgi:hypothetical protein